MTPSRCQPQLLTIKIKILVMLTKSKNSDFLWLWPFSPVTHIIPGT